MQRTSKQARGLRGVFPFQDVTGDTSEISEYLDFFYMAMYPTSRMSDLDWQLSEGTLDYLK